MEISHVSVIVSYKTVTPTWLSVYPMSAYFLENNQLKICQRNIFWNSKFCFPMNGKREGFPDLHASWKQPPELSASMRFYNLLKINFTKYILGFANFCNCNCQIQNCLPLNEQV